jgi:hypothetical protein
MSTDMKGSEMKESNLPDVASGKLSRGKVSTAAREVLHRQITGEWPSAAMKGDIQRYLDFLTDDMVFMPPNHTAIVDKEALREWLNRAFPSEVRHQDSRAGRDSCHRRMGVCPLSCQRGGHDHGRARFQDGAKVCRHLAPGRRRLEVSSSYME